MRWHAIVTGATNPTQLIPVGSRLRQILALRWCGQLTVVVTSPRESVSSHRTRLHSRISAASAVELLPDDPRVRVVTAHSPLRWRVPTDAWAVHIAVGAAGLACYPVIAATNPGRRIPVVVTDEGFGSYGEAGGSGVGVSGRILPRLAALTTHARVEVERWPLHHRVDGHWTVDELVAEEFRARVRPVPVDPQRVVMLTQPWVQRGATSAASYRTHVRDVGRAIRRDGRQLVVRPHPAEDLGCYAGLQMDGIAVMAPTGPAELDPEVLAAAEIIGAPSTAVLTIAAVHGRPARIVAPPVPGVMSGLSTDQRSLLAAHTTPFRYQGDRARVSTAPVSIAR